jgi:acid phosphatase (class A)
MQKTKLWYLLALMPALWAVGAWAEPYFTADKVDFLRISPPLDVKSPQWQRDIDAIVALQAHPDKAALEKASAERNMSPEMVAQAVSPELTRASYPQTYAWLDRVADTSKDITHAAKAHWNTRRPYLMDARVKALIAAHDNPAYPSGHTSGSYVWAQALALVLPQHKQALFDRAAEIAQHRVLVGMHYPHDIAGGRQLALLIMDMLMKNPAFRSDMQEANKELKQGLLR